MKNTSLAGAGILMILACGAAFPDEAITHVQAAAPTAMVEFDVYLPLRNAQQLDELLAQLHDPKSSRYQQWLQPAEFLQRFGPSATDLESASSAVKALGFTVLSSNAHGVRVRGPAGTVAMAFNVAVQSRTRNGRTRYAASSEMQLPGELAALNAQIIGLEATPEPRVNSRITGPISNVPENRYGAYGPYWFDDLKQAYDYPAFSKQTDGSGVRMAVARRTGPARSKRASMCNRCWVALQDPGSPWSAFLICPTRASSTVTPTSWIPTHTTS